MTTLNDARLKWLEDRPRYEAFGNLIATEMRNGVHALGLWCETSSRAKEPHSLIKKLIRKPNHTYESLSDKVGARCIIRYRDDLKRVVDVAKRLFVCGQEDWKADSLGVDHIGYLSVHVEVSLSAGHERAGEFMDLRAELQIRTLAQHLWSEMSHDAVYKNEETFSKLPPDFTRRVNLMAGVIEVADMEFNRLNGELPQQPPEVQLYRGLESHFYKLTARAPDRTLSLDIITLLLPLYQGLSISAVKARVDAYIATQALELHDIYTLQEMNPTSDLIFQPEALLIAEMLANDEPTALRTVWNTKFPEAELERLAVALGHSFD